MGKDLQGNDLGKGLTQVASGKYYARICKDGVKYSKYFDNLDEAKDYIGKYEYILKNNVVLNNISVSRYFEGFIESANGTRKRGTVNTYKNWFANLIEPYLGNRIFADLYPEDVKKWLDTLVSKNYAYSSINGAKMLFKLLASHATDDGIVTRNLFTKSTVINKKNDSKEMLVLSTEEQREFELNCPPTIEGDALLFALQTGMRVGEITGLLWEDVDFKKRIIHVRRNYQCADGGYLDTPKTASGARKVPITQKCMDILKKRRRKREQSDLLAFGGGFVFTENSKPLPRSRIDYRLKRICKDIGIQPLTIHSLRHTFATRCIENGMKPKTLQMILGHSSLAITMDLYVHVTDNELLNEIDRFVI